MTNELEKEFKEAVELSDENLHNAVIELISELADIYGVDLTWHFSGG